MEKQQGIFERFALRISDWSEKWFPDSYIFALLGVIIVSIAALGIGAPIQDVATSFGNGFWSLIPFTLQMTMLIIVGYIGFTVTQLVVHFPLVLFSLWFFGRTLSYTPPTF